MTQSFKSIDPTLAKARFSYDPETGHLIWKHVEGTRKSKVIGKPAGHVHTCTVGKKYVQVRIDGVLHYAHRIIWVLHNGPIPEGMQIDHVDGNGANNRLENLRLVSGVENKRNMRRLSTNTSGATGVYSDKGKWVARFWSDGRMRNIGTFTDKVEAIHARKAWESANGYHPNHGQERAL